MHNRARVQTKGGITIDARWLRSGLGTYTYNLVSRFPAHANGCPLTAIVNSLYADEIAPFCEELVISNAAMYTLREQIEIPWAARGAGLLHVLHYNAPLLHRGPLIVSILDLIHITEQSYRHSVSSWIYAKPMLKMAARKAEHIITISEYSRNQIVGLLGVPRSKVSVIYCGANPEFRPLNQEDSREFVSHELSVPDRYILYVGNLKPHKNVSVLLRAFADLRKRGAISHKLLVVGDDARWGTARRRECVDLGIIDDVTFVKYVTQHFLPHVYAGADLLVMPSTIEGFGLPVLEAMACGTPVICSRAASLPEVAGEAALYFDPSSPEELACAVERLLGSGDLQQDLRLKGLERAKEFSWDESVRKHVELYRQFLTA